MPEDLPPKGPTAELCPRCGAPLHRTTAGLMCFRCLGERALQFDDDAAPAPDATVPPRTAGAAASGLEKLGAYELLDEIGRGGMGVVYTARHAGLDRVVALKIIADGRLATAEDEMRFLREAQTAARLRHRHILTVHDAGRADGHAFYTMDYVEAGDLARRLREGPVAFRASAEIVAACAEAIAHAHTQGVLHRDLKPSNILLDAGEPRIADFGLASSLSTGADLTMQTRVLGTPHYLAPEIVAEGTRAATPASDVYSLGAILFELVAGRPPFGGATSAEVLQLAGRREPPLLHLLNPAVPRDLETIAAKSLEADPARRYRDAGELAADLRRFLAGELILARPVGPAERFFRWCRRRPALAAVWFLVAALAGGASFAAWWIQRERVRAEAGEVRAVAAERRALDQLARAKLEEARALKVGGRMGRRFAGLEALRAAAAIRPSRELRDEATTLLSLLDVRLEREWRPDGRSESPHGYCPTAGVYAVALDEGPISIRSLADSRTRAELTGLSGDAIGLPRFSARARWCAARDADHRVLVWDVRAGGAPVLVLADRDLPLAPVAQDFAFDFDFSPDETRFAAGRHGGGLTVHALPAAAAVVTWESPDVPHIVRFSPDGATLAVSAPTGGLLRLLEAATARERAAFPLPTPPISVEWNATGELLAVSLRDRTTLVLDATTGAVRTTLRTPEVFVSQAVFAHDGRYLLLNLTDNTLALWDWALERPVLVIERWGGRPVVTASEDGRWLTASRWLADTGALLELTPSPVWRRFPPPVKGTDRASIGMSAVAVSAKSGLVAVSNLSGVYLRSLDRDAPLARIDFGSRVDHSAAFSADGKWIFVGCEGTGVARCAIGTDAAGATRVGEPETLFAGKGWRVAGASPTGSQVAIVSHELGLARVFDPARPQDAVEWKVEGVFGAAFSPDGTMFVTQSGDLGMDKKGEGAELREVATGRLLRKLPIGRPGELAWSRSGRLVVTGAQELWVFDDPRVGAGRKILPVPVPRSSLVALDPTGELLALSSNEGLELVRVSDGVRLVRLTAAERKTIPFAITFTADGRRLLANESTGGLVVWDLVALRTELRALGLDWE